MNWLRRHAREQNQLQVNARRRLRRLDRNFAGNGSEAGHFRA
jgi:hypothetical protein